MAHPESRNSASGLDLVAAAPAGSSTDHTGPGSPKAQETLNNAHPVPPTITSSATGVCALPASAASADIKSGRAAHNQYKPAPEVLFVAEAGQVQRSLSSVAVDTQQDASQYVAHVDTAASGGSILVADAGLAGPAAPGSSGSTAKPHNTLMQELQHGAYGAFREAINPLVNDPSLQGELKLVNLELPPIIIMGNLGCGKTSLGQQITGCTAFSDPKLACSGTQPGVTLKSTMDPISTTFWQTNCFGKATSQDLAASTPPVAAAAFAMTHSCASPMNIGKTVRQCQTPKTSHEEVMVCCTCPGCYTEESWELAWSCPLEVIDLPGIKAYPPAAKQTSEATNKAYSLKPNAIILCAVEAGFSDLRAAEALAVAVEAAPNRTVICLTKADLVSIQEVQNKIIDRLQGCAADVQDFKQQPCFAVSGRTSLAEACSAPGSANKLGISSLIRHIAGICEEHVRRAWIPDVRAQLQPTISACEESLRALGPAPGQLTPEDLMRQLHDHVDFQGLVSSLWSSDAMSVTITTKELARVFSSFSAKGPARGRLFTPRLTAFLDTQMAEPPSISFFTQTRALAQLVEDAVSDWLTQADYKNLTLQLFMAALTEAHLLQRFEGLDAAVKHAINSAIDVAAIGESVMDLIAPTISSLRRSATKAMASEQLLQLNQKLRSAVIHEALMPLVEDPARLGALFPADFQIKEGTEAAHKRGALESRLQLLQNGRLELSQS